MGLVPEELYSVNEPGELHFPGHDGNICMSTHVGPEAMHSNCGTSVRNLEAWMASIM
jgi:hypothetical protein